MKEECLICQAPLEYLETETLMEEPSFEVHSAGVRPASEVHPLAVQGMKEIGIDLSHGTMSSRSAEFRRVRDEIRISFQQLAQSIREEDS